MRTWIWGAGEGGALTMRYVQDCAGVVDSDERRHGCYLGPCRVHAPSVINSGDHVVIASIWAREIEAAAHALGATTSLTPLWRSLTQPGATIDTAAVEAVAETLADDHSRAIYAAVLRAWRDGVVVPAGLGEVGSYDLALLGLRPGARVLDGGVYDGQEIVRWLAAEPEIERIYAVDPVPHPAVVRLAAADARVRVYEQALGATHDAVSVRVSGPSTGRECTSGRVVSVRGALLSDFDADLVKLDIEGAEVDAVSGSADWLALHRPRLAVCIYHRMSDLWTIPLLVRRIYPGAALHVRHHSQGLCETVLYVLPEGR